MQSREPRCRGFEPLERGRVCFERHEWNDAFRALSLADATAQLGVEDLHRLAYSASLTARDDEMLAAQERLYHARLDAGEGLAAARAALWLGFACSREAKPGARAAGWAGLNVWSKARGGTASSKAISCCRPPRDF